MLDTQMRERCLRFSSVSALNICFFQTQGVASLFQGKRLESDSFFAPDTSENVTIGGALVAPLVRLTNGMLGYIFHYPEVSVLYRRPEAVEKGLILLSATSAHAFLYDTRAERSVVIPMSNVAVMTRNANRLESYLKKVEDPRGRGGITPPGPGIDYSLKLDNALKKLEAIARAIGSLRNGPLVVKQPNDMEPAVKVLLDEGAALRRDLNRLTNEIERHFSEPDRREWTIDLNVESKGLEDAIKQLEDGLQYFSNIISASKEDGGTRLDTLALAINRGADAIVRMSVALDVYLGERREVNDGRFRPLFGYDDIFPVDCELRRSEAVFLFAHDKAVLSGGVNGSRGMVDAALEDVERLSKELRKRITPENWPMSYDAFNKMAFEVLRSEFMRGTNNGAAASHMAVFGYASSFGKPTHNLNLSGRRAEAVKSKIERHSDFAEVDLTAIARRQSELALVENTESPLARRVEVFYCIEQKSAD